MARAFVIFGDADYARREIERAAVIASTFSLSPPSRGVPLQRTAYYTAQIERVFSADEEPRKLENFTWVEIFGSPYIHWVRIGVDPADRDSSAILR